MFCLFDKTLAIITEHFRLLLKIFAEEWLRIWTGKISQVRNNPLLFPIHEFDV